MNQTRERKRDKKKDEYRYKGHLCKVRVFRDFLLLATSRNLKIVGTDTSAPRCAAVDASIRAQATLGECDPEVAFVLTAGEDLVGLDDGIASLEERGAAGLELHAVKDKPI
jgi:hypothetical protein